MGVDGGGAQEGLGGQLTRQVLQQSPLVVVFDGVGSPALHRCCPAQVLCQSVAPLGQSTNARTQKSPLCNASTQPLCAVCLVVVRLNLVVVRTAHNMHATHDYLTHDYLTRPQGDHARTKSN